MSHIGYNLVIDERLSKKNNTTSESFPPGRRYTQAPRMCTSRGIMRSDTDFEFILIVNEAIANERVCMEENTDV